jgi:plasmid stability protein
MANITVRNLPDEVHRALRIRAAEHGRSTEAEVRSILETVVRPAERVRMGAALGELGRRVGLAEGDMAALERGRDRTPAEPVKFS